MKKIMFLLIVFMIASSGLALELNIKQTNQTGGKVLISFQFSSQTKEGKTQVEWHSAHFIKKNAAGKVLVEIPIQIQRKGKINTGLFTIDQNEIEKYQIRISGNSSNGVLNADHQKDFPLKKEK